MTGSIQLRLRTLETVHGGAIAFIVIGRRPGEPSGEAAFADVRGRRFTPELGEPEEVFLARVHELAAASASPGQRCATVVLTETDLRL